MPAENAERPGKLVNESLAVLFSALFCVFPQAIVFLSFQTVA